MTEFENEKKPIDEELDSDDEEPETQAEPAGKGKHKGDKKTRKAMAKMGMKPVDGVMRVAMKKSKTLIFSIDNPDVYKAATSNTYIVIGEAKVEDLSGNAATQQQMASAAQQYSKVEQATGGVSAGPASKPGAVEDSDETGVEEKDIELVVGQANCTRGAAVAALKNNDNDIVNAIMELTM